ncbi:MAG: AraC family transcriptional regulator, partial [Bacteroidetes bacterium]|nr:AraC family transcriptional regulator [Bacteroidota bacterium]
MTNATEILPGIIFYAYFATRHKEQAGFFEHNTLVLQVSGRFTLETASQRISMKRGQMLLIRKNQLGQITKTPLPDEDYQTIVIVLQEDLLRQIALEEKIDMQKKYTGPSNILVPGNDFLHGYFQSVMPYVGHPAEKITADLGMLKVKEAVHLLLHAMPELRAFLFDFSEPY